MLTPAEVLAGAIAFLAAHPWLALALAAVAAAAGGGGVWWLWWRLPKRQVERLNLKICDPKARADVEDNFRKTVGQLLGGLVVLAGVLTAYVQFMQQQQTTRQQQITQQVSKGFEDLGSQDLMVRLGGIYALEGVMHAPGTDYRLPVLEGLCAFVRAHGRDGKPPDDLTKINLEELATDLRAALTVIARRPPDLAKAANLSGVQFWGLRLVSADLSNTNLTGADLTVADLGLDEGVVQRGANLMLANLTGAPLVLR